jgi:hypothetical protein
MATNDPSNPTAGPDDPAAGPADPTDAIRRLQERLDQASADAERLIREAAGARKPPPAGWQTPDGENERRPLGGDLELLTQLLQSLRDLVPPELERRLAEALRELLLALRALIDFYLERLGKRSPQPTEVEDIPID